MVCLQNCKANTLAETERGPGGLPSKHQVRRANTRDYMANRCALLKYASAGSSVLEEARGPARRASGAPGRGWGWGLGPAGKPRVTDTLISVVFPALRCNQARSNFELSICYPRGRGRELENEGKTWGKELSLLN